MTDAKFIFFSSLLESSWIMVHSSWYLRAWLLLFTPGYNPSAINHELSTISYKGILASGVISCPTNSPFKYL